MNKSEVLCSDDRLWNLLRSDDDGNEMPEAALHVGSCPRCQARLEQLAAEPRDWLAAKEYLPGVMFPEEVSKAHSDASPWNGQRAPNPIDWSASMVQQLLSPPSHPEMLGRIGRYDVERLIGSGGMGVVFKAFDTELNRPVAVKVLAPYLAGSGAARKRFAREARAAAAVVHEHVVAIHNVEPDGTLPFLVMPFVAGESLQQRIDGEGPLDLCEILRIAMQTASGLAAAHAQGLVHRDVKPSNILLEQGVERALLTDFGLARASDDARLTNTGHHPGTPQYMSPEQARGESVDSRSDLFSLGSVIYVMCTGRPPFRAETNYGILRRITDNEPRSIREINPQIPDWLERLVAKLHAKSPADRLGSAEIAFELLERCLAHAQQPTAAPLPESLQMRTGQSGDDSQKRLRQWIRLASTHPYWLTALILILSVCTVSIGWIGWRPTFLRPSTREANWDESVGGQAIVVENDSSPIGDSTSRGMSEPSDEPNPPSAMAGAVSSDWNATSFELTLFADDLLPLEIQSQNLWDFVPKIEEKE